MSIRYTRVRKSFIVIALGSVSGGRSCGAVLHHEFVTDACPAARRTWFLLSSSPMCVYLYNSVFFFTACIVSLQNPVSVLFVNP